MNDHVVRQPAGTPAGGQFAARSGSTPDVDLSPGEDGTIVHVDDDLRCVICGGSTRYGRCPSGRCREALAAAGDTTSRREIARAAAINGHLSGVGEL